MQKSATTEFGRLRNFFWPIYRHELPKLLPMLLVAFFIAFIYHMLRDVKDAVLVTAAGAEVIPFAKVWAMLPMAVLCTSIFVKLSKRFNPEQVFYIVLGSFLAFYMIFVFLLYPIQNSIHPHKTAEFLLQHLPQGLGGLVHMFHYWSFTLFYAMAELWGAIAFVVCFWGFANEITKVSEATRFYAMIALGANVSCIVSGRLGYWLSQRAYNPNWSLGVDRWHQTLILLTLTITLVGILALAIFRWYNLRILGPDRFTSISFDKQANKITHSGSLRKNIKYLAKSRYLICIAVIVVAYNVMINLSEVIWKGQIRAAYPNSNDYQAFMCQITQWIGVVSIIVAWVACGNVVRRFGWTTSAMVVPIAFLITGGLFFAAYFAPEAKIATVAGLVGMTPLPFIAFIGGVQSVTLRTCKYTLFDETKEMAFIPIERDMRLKGKATIDGVGSRFGKSGGSVLQQGLLVVFSTLRGIAPAVALLMTIIAAGWAVAIRSLGQQFHSLTHGAERRLTDEPVPEEEPVGATPAMTNA